MITFNEFITEEKRSGTAALFVAKTHKVIPFRFKENGETMTGNLHVGQLRNGLNKGKVKAIIHSEDRGSSHISNNSWDNTEEALNHEDLSPFQSGSVDYSKHIKPTFNIL